MEASTLPWSPIDSLPIAPQLCCCFEFVSRCKMRLGFVLELNKFLQHFGLEGEGVNLGTLDVNSGT